MDAERHARLKAIFLEACHLNASEREHYLAAACEDDDALRTEAEALLAQHTATQTSAATARMPRAAWLVPGSVVAGRYRVEGELGAGGMGRVYRATQLALRREVALKVLASGPSASEAALARFEREAAGIARLRHPHIVTVYDAGTEQGVGAFFAMELVSGRSLAAELADRGRLPAAEAVELLRQVAEAVDAAHRAGIIHRDLKPDNVMLERSGAGVVAKVLDFGIAKLVDEAAEMHAEAPSEAEAGVESRLTAAGTLVGTPLYMSPEQVRGLAVDARTDVWSLGAVLYELVAGTRPFDRPSTPEVLAAILHDEPEPLDSAAGAPAALARLVERMLAKDPSARFATAGELARELARIAASAALAPSTPFDDGPLIGRDEELAVLVAQMRSGAARLVTLTGPGGTGKTSLARRAARELLGEIEDGAFFVDLSAIRDPALVASAIAEEIGVKESGGGSLADFLVEHLRGKQMMLVLDNFEQVVEAAPFVARMLDASPRLAVLATSRALLRIEAEREFAVPPLAVPSGDRPRSIEELGRCASVALFVERAGAARRGFALTERNGPAVAEICRRLDGLPLAIELAAARVKLLSPEALLARLGERLKLLATGDSDVPERQRTMRGAIAWSYDLLEEQERALLRRLAVFVGGCTVEAAEAVCGNDECGMMNDECQRLNSFHDAPSSIHHSSFIIHHSEVLDTIASLLDKSLLRQREQGDGEVRFLMLEVVREFALERLEAHGETEAARKAHAHYFLTLAEEAGPQLRIGEHQAEWLDRLGREVENLRAALALLLKAEPEAGAHMALSLQNFWGYRSQYTEGRKWLAKALSVGSADQVLRARLLTGLSQLERVLGDYGAAGEHARAGVEASRALADPQLLARALIALGTLLSVQGDAKGAREAFEGGLAHARELGNASLAALCLNGLGEAARVEGEYHAARGYYEQALETQGRQLRTSYALLNLAGVSLEEGDVAAARAFYRESLAVSSEAGHAFHSAVALDGLGAVALAEGNRERAARLAGAAEAVYDAVGTQLEPFEQSQRTRYVAKLREVLAASVLEREWARGRAMTLDEALRFALDE